MPIEHLSLNDAAATPWSAASFCMKQGAKTVFFDHQTDTGQAGGHSILVCEPTQWLVERRGEFFEGPSNRRIDDPVRWIKQHHIPQEVATDIPFVGGIAGYLGFEFGWRLDQFSAPAQRGRSPQMWVGVFPAAAVFDHRSRRWTVYGRDRDAVREIAELIRHAPPKPKIGIGRAEAEFDGNGLDDKDYQKRVRAAVAAIYAGELFEVNFTERIRGIWRGDRRALYDQLRRRAPGDFGGLVAIEDLLIASVSPEQFLAVDASGRVSSRPIKGTRPRGQTDAQDQALAEELLHSAKDRAENIMIVDLMRNDLTRICRPGSIEVSELCELHSYSSVHHLVSTVEGQLSEHFDALDAFLTSFPAGSITGAPKLRAMEWITANERTPRGPYTGSLFYWSDHGRLDSNVLIRSAVLSENALEFGTGGAVVADSSPEQECEEATWKARPFLDLLEPS